MRLLTLFNALMHFKGFVFHDAHLHPDKRSLTICIRPHRRNRPVCSACGAKGSTYDTSRPRLFQHVPLWHLQVFLSYPMRRVNCPRCWIKVERVPWAEGKQRLTTDFRLFLSTWARRVTWSEAATYFRTSWNTVYRAVRSSVEWGLENRDLEAINAIGVDEIQVGKGHQYMTLVYQIDKGLRRLLAVRPDRKAKTLMRCFRDIGPEAYVNIRFVCSDMWKAYLKVVAKRLPQAVHVLDKFHIVASLHKAVDQVRRDETAQMAREGYVPILRKTQILPSQAAGESHSRPETQTQGRAAVQSKERPGLPIEGELPGSVGL